MGDHEELIANLAALQVGQRPPHTPQGRNLWLSGGTANFSFMAWAGWYGWAIRYGTAADVAAAEPYALDAFSTQVNLGHMTLGGPGRCEQGAPDPHSEFYYAAAAGLTAAALEAGNGPLRAAALAWWARDLALSANFSSPDGAVMMPGMRAKSDPAFNSRSIVYRAARGLPQQGVYRTAPFETWLEVGARGALLLLTGRRLSGPPAEPLALWAGAARVPNLALPVRKWSAPDGSYTAALDRGAAVLAGAYIEPADWVAVSSTGERVAYGRRWESEPPAAPGQRPGDSVTVETFGGAYRSVAPSGGGPVTPTPPPAGPPPVLAGAGLYDLANDIDLLQLPQRQRDGQRAIVAELRGQQPRRSFAALADAVASFGIGDNQPQATLWRAVVEKLRALGRFAR